MALALRRLLIGRPIESERAQHERLNNLQALAIFASDGISSTAYATQEILLILYIAGAAGFRLSVPIAAAIIGLLVIVMFSYRQMLFAYPNGGGAYIVARENIGERFAQVAGAALLMDYILTVAVSVSAGVAAMTSAFHHLRPYTVPLCIVAILLLTLGNLRGIRESGNIFAAPTYFFVGMAFLLIGMGLYRVFVQGEPPHAPRIDPKYVEDVSKFTQAMWVFLLLRAFSSGCAALTGIESIAIGIKTFKTPESRNAAITLLRMCLILGTIFMGITWLSRHFGITYHHGDETVSSELASIIFGRGGMYLAFQFATMFILILAANTPFAGFPPLAAMQAADGFLPRQLTNLGERLVFNNGIFLLTVFASILIVIFHGSTDSLIPLYAVGVFLSFTIAQYGMVQRWRRLKTPGWRFKATVNGAGSVTTGVVCLVIAVTKFTQGAWVVILLIPLLVAFFFKINRHYKRVETQLKMDKLPEIKKRSLSKVLVLVPGVTKGAIPAIEFARSLSDTAVGFHVDTGRNPQAEAQLRADWEEMVGEMPLIVVHSPYREVVKPILDFLDVMNGTATENSGPVTVVLPEFVPSGLLGKFLHNQTGLMIKWAMLFRRDVVLCNVRYYLE